MGCDIHGQIECQQYVHRGELDWTHVATLSFLPRHYAVFGALTGGGVRGEPMPDGPALRGLPTDASWDTKDAWTDEGGDGHSPSWVTTSELSRAVLWAENTSPIWQAVTAAMRALDSGGFPSRFVFWFDN